MKPIHRSQSPVNIISMKKLKSAYFRNFIFGVEDALVSTVGVVFGLATNPDYSAKQLIMTGLVVISVEALSMGAGAFLTEESVHEIEKKRGKKDNTKIDALVMFVAYFTSGVLVLAPYLLFTGLAAQLSSIAITVIALFSLGLLPAKKWQDGLRMVTVAGLAILMGFLVSSLLE